jgi:glutamate N-acetyltransferase/amino-acid N-acetyltransferase
VTVTYPKGFVANGIACGIKSDGVPDLAVVLGGEGTPLTGAAVFTTNRAAAAPVVVSREHLKLHGPQLNGVVISSGNANAATGELGLDAARRMCASVGAASEVDPRTLLVCSTGLIGIPLPVERIEQAAAALVEGARADGEAGERAARAMMTTDTTMKLETREGEGFRIGAMAKGAAMIAPNMATMLAVITTDAVVEQSRLQRALNHAVEMSFNRLTIDGCTSTNDTVIVLSSRSSKVTPSDHFETLLDEVCASLALQIARDAEGGSKVVRVVVSGARNEAQALSGARKIAESQLVKCSFLGEDPYWGRVASELGSSGVDFDLARLSVAYQGVEVCRSGVEIPFDRGLLARELAKDTVTLEADLGFGEGTATVLTTDLGYAYIDENKGTS